MIEKMPISMFVEQLVAALERKDGYIMGSKGQNPRKWKTDSWWYTQYSGKQKVKALYWRENAQRVWDCNGLAEGIYEEFSGVNINTKARYNYSNWCSPKGTDIIPIEYRVPGAAVFTHSKSSGYITHVGYLYKPVKENEPSGDWYVIEAKGVMYGVCCTKLYSGNWNRWGWMSKYFDYEEDVAVEYTLGDRLLENGVEGEDVKQLQESLIRLGYDCGRWGADGEFGDATEMAVMEFQKSHRLTADGRYGAKTHTALEKALLSIDDPVKNPKKVTIVGGNCWVRSAPDVDLGIKHGVARCGMILEYAGQTSENGWYLVKFNDIEGWVSGKYGRLAT